MHILYISIYISFDIIYSILILPIHILFQGCFLAFKPFTCVTNSTHDNTRKISFSKCILPHNKYHFNTLLVTQKCIVTFVCAYIGRYDYRIYGQESLAMSLPAITAVLVCLSTCRCLHQMPISLRTIVLAGVTLTLVRYKNQPKPIYLFSPQ